MRILVTGATGVVGREVVAQLGSDHGEVEVRVLTRDPERAAALLPASVELVRGDPAIPASLGAAVAGVDKVFLLTGGGPETPLHDVNVTEAAAAAGVRHVVKLSIIGAEYGFDDLVSTWHLAGERAVRQIAGRSDQLAWTFLRPGEFMSNARLWAGTIKERGKVFWPHGDVPVAVIDPRDVASVAVVALTRDGHDGKIYRIGGPEALSTAERVAILGRALGREIGLVDVPVAAARDGAAKAGRQGIVVETTLNNLGRAAFQEQARKVLATVETVTGKPPRTFEQWVLDHAAIFQ